MWACRWPWRSPRPGEDVVGVDVDHARVSALNDGRSPIEDVSDERLAAALDRVRFSTRYADLARRPRRSSSASRRR